MPIKTSKQVIYTTSDGTEFKTKAEATVHEYGKDLVAKLPRSANGQIAVSKAVEAMIEHADFFVKYLSKISGTKEPRQDAAKAPKAPKEFSTAEVRETLIAVREKGIIPPEKMEAYLLSKKMIQHATANGRTYDLSSFGTGFLNISSTWGRASKSKIHAEQTSSH